MLKKFIEENIKISLLRKVFFSNTVIEYLVVIILIILSFMVTKFVVLLLKKISKKQLKKNPKLEENINKNKKLIRYTRKKAVYLVNITLIFFILKILNFGQLNKYINTGYKILFFIPFGFLIIRYLSLLLDRKVADNKKIDKTLSDLIIKILNITIVSIAIIITLDILGVNITTIAAGLGVGGLAFALAAQDILKNFFSGITLILDGTLTKGNRIKVKEYDGWIEKVNLRTTKIRTKYRRSLITVPNSILANNEIEDVSKTKDVRMSCKVGILYKYASKDIERIINSLKKEIEKHERIMPEFTAIWFAEFGEYSQIIKIVCNGKVNYDNHISRRRFIHQINFIIKKTFEKEKMEMAFPTQTIHLEEESKKIKIRNSFK